MRTLAGHGVTVAPSSYAGLWAPGVPRPDHGPGMTQLICDHCHASWVGLDGEACGWCEDALERMRVDQRRLLLKPRTDGKARYDDLGDDDQAVWRRTRGQTGDADSRRAWAERLGRATRAGIITDREAQRALAEKERLRRAG